MSRGVLIRPRSWRERLLSWPWRPWVAEERLPLPATLVTRSTSSVGAPHSGVSLSIEGPGVPIYQGSRQRVEFNPQRPAPFSSNQRLRERRVDPARIWDVPDDARPELFSELMARQFQVTEPAPPAPPVFVSGGGGDFSGAGASGGWEAPSPAPAPDYAPEPSPAPEPPAPSPSPPSSD